MNKIQVSYSPYRQAFRDEKAAQKSNVQVAKEMVKLEVSPNMVIVGLFVGILALGGLYLMNFNKNSTKGYILKRMEISRQELKDQADLNTLYMAKVKSMNGIIESGRIDHMRKPSKVDYITGDNVIAKAN